MVDRSTLRLQLAKAAATQALVWWLRLANEDQLKGQGALAKNKITELLLNSKSVVLTNINGAGIIVGHGGNITNESDQQFFQLSHFVPRSAHLTISSESSGLEFIIEGFGNVTPRDSNSLSSELEPHIALWN